MSTDPGRAAGTSARACRFCAGFVLRSAAKGTTGFKGIGRGWRNAVWRANGYVADDRVGFRARSSARGWSAALRTWIEPQLEPPITLEPVAIDGKAVRGAKEQHLRGAYLLSAFASRRGAVLAQLAIGERENELTQALPLLRQLDLNDVVVTGDALFAQRALCTPPDQRTCSA